MNSMAFQWNDSFLIGIAELDHEHKVLIDDINRLHQELEQQSDKSEIEKCLGEIFSRMQAHFALEEQVMKEHEYRFYDEHKREHDELLDAYTEHMVRFLNASSQISIQPIEDRLTHWVIHHIVTSDKMMSLMVQDKQSLKTKP